MYSKIAKKQDIYLIDFFLEDVAWYRKLNLNDWIHPNKDWYKKIATNVYEFLKSKKLIKND
jgi:lysophospholipase L1-like esterase